MKDAAKYIQKVHILKPTDALTQVKNHISAHGKAVHGDLHDQMNLPDIIENTQALSHLNVCIATGAFHGLITCLYI